MKVAIFGANGKTGREIVKRALDKGHTVTVFVRDAAQMQGKEGVLKVVSGDVHDYASVLRCVQGQDAVICALGSKDLFRNSKIRTNGTINIIKAMKKSGVQRIVVMSAMGVGESWRVLSIVNKLFFALLMPAAREDHEAQEMAVKASGLAWTIIRPSGLKDAPQTGAYLVGENIQAKTSQISRADVADLMLLVLENKTHTHMAVTITN